MKRFAVFSGGFALALFIWWLAGFDFDTRGGDVACGFVISLCIGGMVLSFYDLGKLP